MLFGYQAAGAVTTPAVTVSAPAISRITWLIPTPHRLTVYASAAPLPDAPATLVIGRLARPYPSGTFPRRIALTSPSARRLRRNRQSIRPEMTKPSAPVQPALERCRSDVGLALGSAQFGLATSVGLDAAQLCKPSAACLYWLEKPLSFRAADGERPVQRLNA